MCQHGPWMCIRQPSISSQPTLVGAKVTLPQERTAAEALRTSSSRMTTLPRGERWDSQLALQPPHEQLALPPIHPHVTTGSSECIIVDSDDELPVQIIARLDLTSEEDPHLTSMVMFKVVHARPSRLKRPLQAEDDVGPNDMAFRRYTMLERDMSQEQLRVRVTRSRGADVYLGFQLEFLDMYQ